jgi:hypothetical protein
MADQYGNLSPEDYAQQQQINRQQKMAQMLMSQNQQPQGQMVSGRYVAPSFFQNILPLVNAYVGRGLLEEGDTKQQALAELIRSRGSQDLQEMLQTAKGTPAQQGGIYGQDGKRTQATTADMYNANLQLNPEYTQKEAIAGQAPNPMAAILKGSNSYNPMARQYAGTLLAQMTKEPELINVPQFGTVGQRNPDGTFQTLYQAPEKISPTEMQKDYKFAVENDGYSGSFTQYQKEVKNMKERPIRISVGGGGDGGNEGGGVNNNGVPVGRYDKMGRYTSPSGRVFPASAVNEAQKEHDAGMALINKLNDLSEDDITNAFGSLTDYSTTRIGRMAGPTKTLDAQVKINNLQIGSVLNNLSQLKGASSDKEMAQMIKDFPGYEASPDIMKNWVERAAKETNRFLKMREDRFAFDTEYAKEGRFKTDKSKTNTSKLSPQDQEALAWANANPKDTRSADIKKRLGQ